MRFRTKLWKRSEKSFATTIPHIVLFELDKSLKLKYNIDWKYISEIKKWSIRFVSYESKKFKIKVKSKLWKRSQKSFATTIPHIVLLHIDESKYKNYQAVWEFNSKNKIWTISIVKKSKGGDVNE